MIELRDLDATTTTVDQLRDHDEADGPVVLINTFTVPPAVAEDFVAVWAGDRAYMSGRGGFIAAELHAGIAGSHTYMAVAHWASLGALRTVLTDPEFRNRMGAYPDGTTSAPHVFRKVPLN